jgi:hypothetical protein
MRFTAANRLIDLMVGQLLYKSPDVAIRELIQNAEDACALQQLKGENYQPEILVRYSMRENWLEVADNGLGMNQEAFEASFAAVGASKEDVSHVRDLLAGAGNGAGRQIAFFGVGVLSCFGVADKVNVSTKMDDHERLAFDINDYHDDWLPVDDGRTARGTTIRLQLKDGGPMQADHVPVAVDRYARHALHVALENADSGERRNVVEQWHGSTLVGALALSDPDIRSGFLALHPEWDNAGNIPQTELVLCNAGFLVKERELDLLPSQAIGYVGEIDVKPQTLTIQLNREGFNQDDKWREISQKLTVVYNKLLGEKLDDWARTLEETPEKRTATALAMEKGVLLLARGPIRPILEPALAERVDRLLPATVRVHVRSAQMPTPLSDLLARAQALGVIYYIREGEAPRQFQQSLQQGSGTVQVTEVAQTEALRATHLQAKGALVLSCRPRSYPYVTGAVPQNLGLHEADIVSEQCQKHGIRFVAVNDASADDVALTEERESALLSDLLGLGEPLKLVNLEGFHDRVLRDVAGRLLNCRNSEIRELLEILPDAVGNPVRRALLKIYLDIESYRLTDARQEIKTLLLLPDLAEQAQLTTGQFLRAFIQTKLDRLLNPPAKPL